MCSVQLTCVYREFAYVIYMYACIPAHTYTHTLSATPMKVVIRFASGIAYCYNFCKKILLRVLHNFLPGEVVDLMCSVASVFLQHLIKIGFEKITQNLGGWVS